MTAELVLRHLSTGLRPCGDRVWCEGRQHSVAAEVLSCIDQYPGAENT